jgi:hypothetical protein
VPGDVFDDQAQKYPERTPFGRMATANDYQDDVFIHTLAGLGLRDRHRRHGGWRLGGVVKTTVEFCPFE